MRGATYGTNYQLNIPHIAALMRATIGKLAHVCVASVARTERKRNPGLSRVATSAPDFASLHPGYNLLRNLALA
jgi:hypothetical protein